MKVDRALFLGRFQPMHLGHLDVVQRLSMEHEEVVVAIGSANVSHTPINPFTGGERVEMVHAATRDAGLANVLTIPIPDVGRNTLWASHVESLVPRFSVFYSNNPLPARLFREAGHEVRPAPFHQRAEYEGTRIRKLMIDGGAWRELVPRAVADVIEAIHGVERLRELAHGDGVVEGYDPTV